MEKNQKSYKNQEMACLKSKKFNSLAMQKIAEKENEKRVIEAHDNY